MVDCWQMYRMLLLPLEQVHGSPVYHPEGDVLYHSLQVFELARDHRPYDEEFLLAALLHDVGKGLDRSNHVEVSAAPALEALAERNIVDGRNALISYTAPAAGTNPSRA